LEAQNKAEKYNYMPMLILTLNTMDIGGFGVLGFHRGQGACRGTLDGPNREWSELFQPKH
jgi:hypothetical protein